MDLVFEKGVKSSDLNREIKILTVEYNPKRTDADKIRNRIGKIGYNSDSMNREEITYFKLPDCCKYGAHQDNFLVGYIHRKR